MGFLRIFLALVVVAHHISSHIKGNTSFPAMMASIDAMVAVLVFFIFSGFYMSMVINQKYAKSFNHPFAFYVGRILRIYPLYWLILLLSYVYSVFSGHLGNVGNIRNLTGFTWYWQVFMNVTTLGLDMAPALGSYGLPLVGTAWSLSTEMLFYMVAPWLVRLNIRWTLVMVAAIFAVRLTLYGTGGDRYPLRVLFFPLSLSFFMLGHLSFRIYEYLLDHRQTWLETVKRWRLGIVAIPVLLIAARVLRVGRGIDPEAPELLVLYVLLTVLIPVIFYDLKRSPVDKFLGDLSFPLYISHALFLTIVAEYTMPDNNAQLTIALVGSLMIAVLLTLAVERPIERMRLWVNNKLLTTKIVVSAKTPSTSVYPKQPVRGS